MRRAFLTKSSSVYVVSTANIGGFSNRGVPGRDESGRIVCWYVLLTDIDERKRFEGELRRSEAFLAGAQRLSETGSFLWSPETDALTWSTELYRMFELDEGGITLEQVGSRVHADDIPIFNDMIDEGRGGGGRSGCRDEIGHA